MADDREVLREIWDGKVPVRFVLTPDEVSVEQPEPIYLLVPRNSYFPLVTDKVHRHFVKYVDSAKTSEMWLESEGQPLKWHNPVGVLFDMYGSENLLPWNITVHFQNFPESEILHCHSREAVEAHFMASVKEADCLKHRGQVINNMQKRDHKQLWMGLQNDKFDQFWAINKKLMEHSGDDKFKHIPFRIYQADKPYIQKLFRPVSDEGNQQSLSDLLQAHAPHTLPTDETKRTAHRIIIQGIEPSLVTPVQWLSEHFSHPDNFLHICVVRNS